MRLSASLLTGLLGLAAQVSADPIWPSNIDELEEIMYQVFSFNSRKFADNVNPCSREVFTAGRKNAAEWLRTAFHDMSTANIYQNFGGLDASLQFELGPNSENTGPAFANTLTFLSPYVTRKSSMSDLIALGVYTSVLSCGGPAVPFRAGRVDATQAGNPGVPQPQNDIATFRNQFLRLGFSPQEMIQVTACGHTIGGVHSAENPDIVPAGRFTDDVATFDTTDAVFDNKIVTEYLDGTTKNPLVVRFGTSTLKSSDLKVFNSDRNVTMRGMRDPGTFQSVCGTVFEKMINVVPPGVTLGDPITPYQVKPVQIQLTLSSLASMQLTGSIRVLSTPTTYTNIAGVTINYKNRSGGTTCGSGPCSFNLNLQGTTRSLDNNIFFVWFPITQQFIPTSSGISSFTITVNMKDGSSKLYDNNGNGYPVQDGVFLQSPQSCLDKSAGTGTFVAAVRNDRASLPVTMEITYKTRLTDNTNVATSLKKMTLDMTKGDCRGSYTFFTASVSIPGGVSVESTIDVISGSGASAVVDSFKKAGIAGGTCQSWTGGSTCSSVTVSSITPSTTSSSAAPTASLHHRDTMGGYKLVSCWTEASNGRALTGAAFSYDGMTLDSCMKNCTGFNYWGTEYGRECYCGNSLDATSTSAALGDCNFPCSGDSTQYCGAGNRIELYSTTASIAAPTATLAHVPVVGKFSLVGCQTEAANNQRALQGAQTVSDSMTLEMCATFCSDFTYFGTEYGRECYCGNSLLDTSKPALITECNMKCSGNPYQYCGDGFRLDLYKVSSTSSSSVVSTAAATPTSSGSSTFVTSSILSSSSSTLVSAGSLSTQANSGSPSARASASASPITSPATTSSSSGGFVTSTSSVPGSSTSTSSLNNSPSISSSASVSANGQPTSPGSTAVSTSTQSPSATPSSQFSSTQVSSSSGTSISRAVSPISSPTSPVGSALSTPSNPSTLSTMVSSSVPSTSQNAVASSTTTTSSASSIRPTLAHKPTVAAYTLTGCWTEGQNVRALSQKSYTSHDNMTLENCASFCSSFKYFGTEYSSECYCSNFLALSSSAAPLADCSMTCSGNQYEYCGGGNRLTLYASNETVTGPNQPQTIGAYTSLGCRTEPAQGGRALGMKSFASDKMSNDVCAGFCDGFAYFGTEYSGECYCGTTLPDTAREAPASDCNMLCSGNSTQFCGGPDRLSVYKK